MNFKTIQKIISIITIMSLGCNGIVIAGPIDIPKETLQVQSIYNSFGKINSDIFNPIYKKTNDQYDETQIQHEVLLILQMFLRKWIPHNIDAEIDKMLDKKYRDNGKKRIFNVLPATELTKRENKENEINGKEYKTVIDIGIDQGPFKGERFRIYSNFDKKEELLSDKGKLWIEPVEQSPVAGRWLPEERLSVIDDQLSGEQSSEEPATRYMTHDMERQIPALKETPGRHYIFNASGQLWKVVDDRGTVWEQYENTKKNGTTFEEIYLYNPKTSEYIKCRNMKGKTNGTIKNYIRVYIKNKEGKYEFTGLVYLEENEKDKRLMFGEIDTNKGTIREAGTGKTLYRWIAMMAHRKGYTLYSDHVYSPIAAYILEQLYDAKTIRLIQTTWDRKQEISRYEKGELEEEKVKSFILEQKYSIRKAGKDEITVGNKDGITIAVEYPRGYKIRIKNRKITAINSEGREIEIFYTYPLNFSGTVNAERIIKAQEAERFNGVPDSAAQHSKETKKILGTCFFESELTGTIVRKVKRKELDYKRKEYDFSEVRDIFTGGKEKIYNGILKGIKEQCGIKLQISDISDIGRAYNEIIGNANNFSNNFYAGMEIWTNKKVTFLRLSIKQNWTKDRLWRSLVNLSRNYEGYETKEKRLKYLQNKKLRDEQGLISNGGAGFFWIGKIMEKYPVYLEYRKIEQGIETELWIKIDDLLEEQSPVASRRSLEEQGTGDRGQGTEEKVSEEPYTTYDIPHTALRETPNRDYIFNEKGQLWKVIDDKKIVWEENEYDDKGELQTVYLHRPENGKRIKCEVVSSGHHYSDYEERELLVRQWKIKYEDGDKFIDSRKISTFSVKEVYENREKLADHESYLCLTNIQTRGSADELDKKGTGKAIKSWLALKAFREQKRLKAMNTYSPIAANINISCELYDRATLTVYSGNPYIELADTLIWDDEQEESLQDALFEREYTFEHKEDGIIKTAEISIEEKTRKVIKSANFPKGYTYHVDLEKRRIEVFDKEGKNVSLDYTRIMQWDGLPDAAKITKKQDEEEKERPLVAGRQSPGELATSHMSHDTEKGTLNNIGKQYKVIEAKIRKNALKKKIKKLKIKVRETQTYEEKTLMFSDVERKREITEEQKTKIVNTCEQPENKLLLKRILNTYPENIYQFSFNERYGDLLGFNLPYKNMIFLQKELADNPVAQFHEFCHVLIDKKDPRLNDPDLPMYQIWELGGIMDLKLEEKDGKYYLLIKIKKKFQQHYEELFPKVEVTGAIKDLAKDGEEWVWRATKNIEGFNLREDRHYHIRILQRALFGEEDKRLTKKIKDLQKKEFYEKNRNRIGNAYVAEIGEVIDEIEKDIKMDKKTRERLNAFYEQYIEFARNVFGENVDKEKTEKIKESFNAENIADLFYLQEKHGFNIFDLLIKKGLARPKTNWIALGGKKEGDYTFSVGSDKNIVMRKVGEKKQVLIRENEDDPFFFDKKGGYLGRIQLNFLIKLKNFIQWADKKKWENSIDIKKRKVDKKENEFYSLIGAEMKQGTAGREKALFSEAGNLSAGLLSRKDLARVKNLDERLLLTWSQRKLDRYLGLTEEIPTDEIQKANKAFSSFLGNRKNLNTSKITPEKVAEFIILFSGTGKELEKDIEFTKEKDKEFRQFFISYLKRRSQLQKHFSGSSLNDKERISVYPQWIADQFYLKDVYGFDAIELEEKGETRWTIKEEGQEEVTFLFEMRQFSNVIEVYKEKRTKKNLVATVLHNNFSREDFHPGRRGLREDEYKGNNVGNFAIKTFLFYLWKGREGKTEVISVGRRKGKINGDLGTMYETIGAELFDEGKQARFDVIGGLDAGILTNGKSGRINGLNKHIWRVWSQRQVDRFLRLTRNVSMEKTQEANQAFSDLKKDFTKKELRKITPEEVAGFVFKTSEEEPVESPTNIGKVLRKVLIHKEKTEKIWQRSGLYYDNKTSFEMKAYSEENGEQKESTFYLEYIKKHGPPGDKKREEITLSSKEPYRELTSKILDMFPRNIPLYTYPKLKEDLLGFVHVSDQENVNVPDLIGIYRPLSDNPIAVFYEIIEFLIKTGKVRLIINNGKMHININGQEKVIDISEVIKELNNEGEVWVKEEEKNINLKEHYLIRILQRSLFGKKDKQLTETIKEKLSKINLKTIGGETSIPMIDKNGYEAAMCCRMGDKIFVLRKFDNIKNVEKGKAEEVKTRDFFVFEVKENGDEKFAGDIEYIISEDDKNLAFTGSNRRFGEITKYHRSWAFYTTPKYRKKYRIGKLLVSSAVQYMREVDKVEQYSYSGVTGDSLSLLKKVFPGYKTKRKVQIKDPDNSNEIFKQMYINDEQIDVITLADWIPRKEELEGMKLSPHKDLWQLTAGPKDAEKELGKYADMNVDMKKFGINKKIPKIDKNDYEAAMFFKVNGKIFVLRTSGKTVGEKERLVKIRDFFVFEIKKTGKEVFAGALEYFIAGKNKKEACTKAEFRRGDIGKYSKSFSFKVEREYRGKYRIGKLLLSSAVKYMKEVDKVESYLYVKPIGTATDLLNTVLPGYKQGKVFSFGKEDNSGEVFAQLYSDNRTGMINLADWLPDIAEIDEKLQKGVYLTPDENGIVQELTRYNDIDVDGRTLLEMKEFNKKYMVIKKDFIAAKKAEDFFQGSQQLIDKGKIHLIGEEGKEYINKCFSPKRIADLFYLKKVYGFDIFQLMKNNETAWIHPVTKEDLIVKKYGEDNIVVEKENADTGKKQKIGEAGVYLLEVLSESRKRNISSLMIKISNFIKWTEINEKQAKWHICYGKGKTVGPLYEQMGAEVDVDKLEATFSLFGGLDAGILTKEQAERMRDLHNKENELNPLVWRSWSQREIDRYFRLTKDIRDPKEHAYLHKRFSDSIKFLSKEDLRAISPEEVARFVNNNSKRVQTKERKEVVTFTNAYGKNFTVSKKNETGFEAIDIMTWGNKTFVMRFVTGRDRDGECKTRDFVAYEIVDEEDEKYAGALSCVILTNKKTVARTETPYPTSVKDLLGNFKYFVEMKYRGKYKVGKFLMAKCCEYLKSSDGVKEYRYPFPSDDAKFVLNSLFPGRNVGEGYVVDLSKCYEMENFLESIKKKNNITFSKGLKEEDIKKANKKSSKIILNIKTPGPYEKIDEVVFDAVERVTGETIRREEKRYLGDLLEGIYEGTGKKVPEGEIWHSARDNEMFARFKFEQDSFKEELWEKLTESEDAFRKTKKDDEAFIEEHQEDDKDGQILLNLRKLTEQTKVFLKYEKRNGETEVFLYVQLNQLINRGSKGIVERNKKIETEHPEKLSIAGANLQRAIDKPLKDISMKRKHRPVDIIIDLTLLNDKSDSILRGNIREIVRLMLEYRKYEYINVCFKKAVKKGTQDDILRDNIEWSPKYDEIKKILKEELIKQTKEREQDIDVDIFMRERINKKRNNSIKIPILNGEYLEWIKEWEKSEEYFNKDHYPVALEGYADYRGNIALWDFEGAFVMALVKASLAIAKERKENASEEEKQDYERAYSQLKKEILPRINKFFSERGEFEKINERSLDNMVAEEVMARITLALKFALPPIMRDAAERIEQIQKSTYRIMRDA